MAKEPAFLFYVDDFEGGTSHMTDSEVGCYLRLLIAQFGRGELPDDTEFLKRFADSFTESWPIVKEKFKKSDKGTLYNERMELVRQQRAAYSKSRLLNRYRSAQSVKLKF